MLKIFGSKNHAYCYRHLKENFSSFLNKQNAKGCKRKENALEWLDKIAYVRLDTDYNAHMFELRKYNESLATWIKQYETEHCAMSKFPTHRWDKMTTNLVVSFNAWLRNERHHSICSFIVEHITKLGALLVKHKQESNNWKCTIGPKIDEKIKNNIAKGVVYLVSPFIDTFFVVVVSNLVLNVDIVERTCICHCWKMSSIPCEHACPVILFIGQDVAGFVDVMFKLPA